MLITTSCSGTSAVRTDEARLYPGNVQPKAAKRIKYDTAVPDFKVPYLLKPAHDYNPDDMSTLPVYTGLHTIKWQTYDNATDHYAIWCTHDATYLTYSTNAMWENTYFYMSSNTYIIDEQTHERYKLQYIMGLPLDTVFFTNGIPGQSQMFVGVFPPLPERCTLIGYEEGNDNPSKLPFGSAYKMHNVAIATLQANQTKNTYRETRIIQ